MKKILACLLAALLLLSCAAAQTAGFQIAEADQEHFAALLYDLLDARADPEAEARIDADLAAIRAVSEADSAVAESIAAHWREVYLDAGYALFLYDGGQRATALEETGERIEAIVVLGYALQDGEMTKELMGRCKAAAAVARSFPEAILVCTGGPTGQNNPKRHTEAGLMRAYLVDKCGIDARRIRVDESAMSTVENAMNTFAILEREGVGSMTIVTSTYHQRWGQAVYNAVGAIRALQGGRAPAIAGNYCFDIEPSVEVYRDDARVAAYQISVILGLADFDPFDTESRDGAN